jgi:hypothetical protein
MNLKLVVAVSLFAAIPVVAYAQQNTPTTNPPKPSTADVQKLVQSISGDKAKLKTYCDIGKLQDQMDQAEQKKDTRTLEALNAKADDLGKQLGPDYEKIMGALERIDPSSAEGKRYTALFQPLFKQCR